MIAEFESRILALIDDMVEHASDDELFASGYLRGHLTLAVAELEAGTITLPTPFTLKSLAAWKKPFWPGSSRRATSLWC